MAWHWTGDKPFSEPMMVSLLTHICHSASMSDAYMHQWTRPSLIQIMACRLTGAKPLSKPTLGYYQLNPWEQTSVKFQSKYKTFHWRKRIWNCRLPKWWPFCPGGEELREYNNSWLDTWNHIADAAYVPKWSATMITGPISIQIPFFNVFMGLFTLTIQYIKWLFFINVILVHVLAIWIHVYHKKISKPIMSYC